VLDLVLPHVSGIDAVPSRILLQHCRMRVRVVRKLADWVDGIDLSHCTAGDLIDLAERQARIMIAERWAVFARRAADRAASAASEDAVASTSEGRRLRGDRRRSSRLDLYQRLRVKREHVDQQRRRLRRRATDGGQQFAAHPA
jgi:hypothetical protein